MDISNNMGRFFDWLAKPMNDEDINAWYLANNITPEHTELFRDFCLSFYYLINETYLGDDDDVKTETKVGMTNQQKKDHFNWCWKKIIDNFERESISFDMEGDHYEYFFTLFNEIYYRQSKETIRNSIDVFFNDLFNREKAFTQVDLDLIFNIYKTLDKNLKV